MLVSLSRMIVAALPMALFGCGLTNGQSPVAPGTTAAPESAAQADDPVESKSDQSVKAQQEALDKIGAIDASAAKNPAQILVKEDYLSFVYVWPETLSRYPVLNGYFEDKASTQLADMQSYMADDDRLSDPNAQFKPEYVSETAWSIHGTSGRLISLLSDFYSFTGGAHGIYGAASLLYDTQSAKTLEARELFADESAAREAIQPTYCSLLDEERSKRRGGEVGNPDDLFWDCIDPLEQTLIFRPAADGGKFDRLIIYAGPYSAGPYVEGDYTIELPVSAELRAAIKAEYRDDFGVNTDAPIVDSAE